MVLVFSERRLKTIATLFVLSSVLFLYFFIPPRLPVPPEQMEQALLGVSFNNDWLPVERRIQGVRMILVPSGCFEMGTTEQQLEEATSSCEAYYGSFGCQADFANEQPSHQVCLSTPYWIDRTTVTNAQFGSSSNVDPNLPSKAPNWPRESVTWQDALDYCAAHDGRLPTEAEWEFAARGPDALIYPFGNEYQLKFVTLRKISPAVVGEHPEGASWVGAMDMSGGVGEWVSDWYDEYPTQSLVDPQGPNTGNFRIVRGGDWFAHAAFLVRTTYRELLDPEFASSKVGFRCVREFEP